MQEKKAIRPALIYIDGEEIDPNVLYNLESPLKGPSLELPLKQNASVELAFNSDEPIYVEHIVVTSSMQKFRYALL